MNSARSLAFSNKYISAGPICNTRMPTKICGFAPGFHWPVMLGVMYLFVVLPGALMYTVIYTSYSYKDLSAQLVSQLLLVGLLKSGGLVHSDFDELISRIKPR